MSLVAPENFNGSCYSGSGCCHATTTLWGKRSPIHHYCPLSVAVLPVNDDPVAADDTETRNEDSDAHAFSVLSNDTDVDLDTLTITSAAAQSGGTATVSPDRTQLIYQPAANFHGQETVIMRFLMVLAALIPVP